MKRIYRSQDDKIIAGVCGGFAEYFGIDPTLIRLIWIFFTIFGGIGILAYIFSIILIPESTTPKTGKTNTPDDFDEKLVLWGVVIIIIGLVLFFRHKPMVSMMWDAFGGNWIGVLFAFSLIGLGIYIFINRKNENEKFVQNLNISGLCLSNTDKKLAGVCGGIAEAINVDSTIVRLIWILGTLLSGGLGIILYFICILLFSKSKEDISQAK